VVRFRVRGLLVAVIGGLFLMKPLLGATPRTVDLVGLGKAYGMTVTWLDPEEELRLQSKWTTLEFEAGSREMAWNGHRLFLGEPIRAVGRSLGISPVDLRTRLVPLLNPAAVPAPGALRLIAIDAGHGGNDTGASNPALKLQEKQATLDVARRLRTSLLARGYKVVLTRANDRYVALDDRPQSANRAKADLFISIHFNSLPGNAKVSGIETYVFTPSGVRSTASHKRDAGDQKVYAGNSQDHWNMVLASSIHDRLLDQLGVVDRGLKTARFAVLRTIRCPAVLIEAGFLSHPTEARNINTPAHRQRIAEAIADGVGDYAGRLRLATPKG
jgi:N-acetylmuramoyl-L-alanine amidase